MNGKVNLNIWLLVSVLLLVLAGHAGAVTHYVSPGQSIQTAIDDANDGDEIEVAPGTYYEAINFNGKAVHLYSSDGPDVTTIDANGLNSSVFKCESSEDANTVLEGFTITGGSNQYGGGMYNYYSNPTVTNCIFINNSAVSGGGGMRNDNSSPTVTNCTFTGNSAPSGGGMANSSSSPTITNCTFSGNSAYSYGGMANFGGSATLTKCTFTGNTAIEYGGAMGNSGDSTTLSNCIFSNNTAVWGGGIENFMSGLTVTNCMFIGNIAPHGGGIFSYNSSSMKVTNCIFRGNEASTRGGGMLNIDSNLTLTNCTFNGNSSQKGGGMNNNASSPTVTNCIFWGNTPDEIYNQYSSPSVTYSDVQGGWAGEGNINTDPLFVDESGGDLRLSSSSSPCVDTGDNSAPALPATDLADNPRIADGDQNGTVIVDMGAYELQDLAVHNITQDLWYERIQAAIDDANDGDEIELDPETYKEAINFNGKAVRLYSSGGRDVTTIDANGIEGAYHVVQCVSREGPDTVLEGFTITGGNANGFVYPDDIGGGMYNYESSPTVKNCIFTGNTAVYSGGGMYNENCNPGVTNCIFIDNATTGAGGGMVNEYGGNTSVTDCNFISNTANQGGGMYNYRSDLTLTNCRFSDNTANDGGGAYNYYSRLTVTTCIFSYNAANYGGGILNKSNNDCTITKCIFTGNTAESYGGGMLNESSSPVVTDCTFSGNEASSGGGLSNDDRSSPTVTYCTFSDNEASYGGGMLNQSDSNPKVTNCTFSGNTADYSGGGIYNYSSRPRLRNCTLTDNSSIGSGVFNHYSYPTLTSCILWGNTSDEIFDIESSSRLDYCDIEGGWSGEGSNNIDADPCFVNAAGGNLRLSTSASPCVDAGDSTLLLAEGIYLDLDGKIRYVDIESIVDTGSGPLEFLDMGAYEFNCNYTAGDSNCDGVVDFKDLAILCGNWLAGY